MTASAGTRGELALWFDDGTWRYVACALCGSSERSTVFQEGAFSVVDCSACGLRYVTPRLEDADLIEQVYDASYWRSSAPRERGYADYVGDDASYLRTFELRERYVRRFRPAPGRVLDVGCASGAFLRVMRARGWSVHGIEPSDPIRAVASRHLGAESVDADWDRCGSEFDLVTLWDVLEHAPDPVELLRRAAAALVPGGLVLVETQNVRSFAARVLGRRWQHYKHLEHLVHFDPHTLARALSDAGLRPIARTSRFAGKFVDARFVVERAQRVHPLLSRLAAPLVLLGRRGFYVNPFDEMIVVAAHAADERS